MQSAYKKLKDEYDMLKKEDEELKLKLLNASFLVQEEERKRISKDLHDEIGSHLISLKFNLEALYRARNLATNRMSGEENLFGDIFKSIDEIITRNKEIVYDISPVTLEQFGLETAVSSFLQRINNTYTVITEVFSEGNPCRLPDKVEMMVYRVIQEIATNAMKYSDRWRFKVTFNWKADKLNILINQDCRILSTVGKKTSQGQNNIKSRILLINGTITRKDSIIGSEYLITVPYVTTPYEFTKN